MRPVLFVVLLTIVALAGISATPAAADIDVGSDGSDGILILTSDTEIDLSQAPTASWDTPAPMPGSGVYDPQQWAVVFKYDSVYIASGAFVSFANHPSRAPVVWLVARGVRLEGRLYLSGATGTDGGTDIPVPGPGGFRGGKGGSGTTGGGGAGMGPGGGQYGLAGGGGGYGSAGASGSGSGANGIGGEAYGGPQILPLIGGSGGGGTNGRAGGAGGGGIMIAAARSVELVTTAGAAITANGGGGYSGSGAGSGGAIRIIADSLAGSATLYAQGGNTSGSVRGGGGGVGYIRLETNKTGFTGGSYPLYSFHLPVGPTAVLWPPAGSPRVAIASVAGQTVPSEPTGDLLGGDLQIGSATAVPVVINAENVPADATVTLRAVLVSGGNAVTVNATFASGNSTASTWSATLPAIANNAYTMLQARVTLP